MPRDQVDAYALCNQLVLIERVPLVDEDPVERSQVGRILIEPGIHVLGLDADDGPVVAGGGHLGLGVVGDGSERQQIRLLAGRIRRT